MINQSRTHCAFLATAMLSSVAYQCALGADLMPEPSPGFSPHSLYAIDQQTAVAVMHKTLSELSIPELTGTGSGITTDYIDGPSTTNGGRTNHSRYQYVVTFRPMLGNRTAVNVVTRIEAATTSDGAPASWHDTTLFNLGLTHKASGWLYEQYEHVLAGGAVSGQASPGPTTPTSANGINAPSTNSQSGGGAASDFDIVGLRLGMTADEARRALHAMNMPVYKEYTDSLSYQTKVSNAIVEVPNSGFVSAIYTGTANSTGHSSERFLIFFTPDGGHERALEIVHAVGLEPTSPMLVQNFQDGVIKKYGKPSFSPGTLSMGSNWLMWAANSASFEKNSCVSYSSTFAFRDPAPTARDMRNPAIDTDQRQLENFKHLCGSSYLAISFDYTTTVAGSAAMIGYSARLVSPQLTLEGLFAASDKIQAASRASDLKDVDKAAHQEGPKL